MTTYIEPLIHAYQLDGATGLNLELNKKDYGPLTLEEIGQVLGITRERVRQIQDHALKKLSNPRFGRHLKHYVSDHSKIEASDQDIGRDGGANRFW